MKGTRTPLIIVLAVGILFAPLAGEAQEGSKVYKLGFLMGMDPQPAWQAAFKQGLQEFGWVEGRNITIEYLSAEGDFDRLPRLCTELVSHAVDLILAVSALAFVLGGGLSAGSKSSNGSPSRLRDQGLRLRLFRGFRSLV